MKRLIFVLIFISFSSNAFPQWLVDGGNLIWPYGDVTIISGSLIMPNTSSNLIVKSDSIVLGPGVGDAWLLIDAVSGVTSLTYRNGDGKILFLDMTNYAFWLGDLDGVVNGNYLLLDDGNNRTIITTPKVKLSIPSDSTTVSLGELYFNSTTGAIHRKF